MKILFAKSFKGQIKIQQTAFMLLALVIFFVMIGLIYFSFSLVNLRERAQKIYEKEALETIKMFAGVPELAFTASSACSNCIDLDKAVALLEERSDYAKLWNFTSLEIEIVYPRPRQADCNRANYPICNKIIIIDGGASDKRPKTAFVATVRWDRSANQFVYGLGKIRATERIIN